MNISRHMELQASAQQWVENIMKNYNVTATEMADIFSKILVDLNNRSMLEYFFEINSQQQQAPQEEEGYDN